jgi:hypothetical protein
MTNTFRFKRRDKIEHKFGVNQKENFEKNLKRAKILFRFITTCE